MFGASTSKPTEPTEAPKAIMQKKATFEDVAMLVLQRSKEKKILTEKEKAAIFRNKIEMLTSISVDEQDNKEAYLAMQAKKEQEEK